MPYSTVARKLAFALLALFMAFMVTPLFLSGAAYGASDTVCQKIEFGKPQPTTWTSDGHYDSVTVKAGQVKQTWNNVSPGQTLGPIIRDSNGKPIEFSNLTKCTVVAPTTTTAAPTTTTAAPTTTTAAPTTTTAAPTTTTTVAPTTTTTVAPTTTTAPPTTTTLPTECRPPEELDEFGNCSSPSITLSAGCWDGSESLVGIENHRTAIERPRGIQVHWSFGSQGGSVVVPPLSTVYVELTDGPTGGPFMAMWSGTQIRGITISSEECPVPTTTTTLPDDSTTTTTIDVTTTTEPDDVTTTTEPDEVTTTTDPTGNPDDVTSTTEAVAVPADPTSTTKPEKTSKPTQVSAPAVAPVKTNTLPYTGSELQMIGFIGTLALLAGGGMVKLVGKRS